MDPSFFHSNIYTFVIIPFLIFFARVCDVTIGTIRILMLSRGYKLQTVILGFFELMIWLLAIGQVFQNLDNFVCYVAYAGGFAMGNFIGMTIEEKMALGSVIIRVVTKKEANELIEHLKTTHYRFTSINAQGSTGNVHVLFMVVKRKSIKTMIKIIDRFNPYAFYTIEDVRQVREGVFSLQPNPQQTPFVEMRQKGK